MEVEATNKNVQQLREEGGEAIKIGTQKSSASLHTFL
jgi:hypothetical protein